MAARVLVVDDETDIRDLFVVLLEDDERCGKISTAGSCEEALAVARRDGADVVVLDFNLGNRSSDQILPELRTVLPDAKIVVFTANRDAAERANVRRLGANDVVEKATVSFDAVIEIILGDGAGGASASA